MGRPEAPLDPSAGPVQQFAYALRKLRQDTDGLTYRAMARSAHYSVTVLAQAAAGTRLPSLAVTLAYVRACGGDVEEWEHRWNEANEAVAAAGRGDAGRASPYQGLARFEPDDHARFFGRDALVAGAETLVGRHRFAAILGPSGSGKSSLLRAGLIPALRAAGQDLAAIRILTPGARPARVHAAALEAADGDADTVLVVDQFEEVFTLCHDPAERTEFIDLLLAARDPVNRLRVVIAVRADFYGRCAEHRALADALPDCSLLVGPMNAAELRAAVVGPAQTAGLIVERELTARLTKEVEGEPGGLPLMSHVLRETWLRRRGRVLTVAACEAAGGLHGAIAKTAETVYTRLTAPQAHLARLLLLRLVTPGEGGPDTRRPVSRSELDLADGSGDVDQVLERLAHARLITLGEDTVDLAHEALITSWPRLHTWIDDARDRLRLHRRLTDAAHAWQDLDHDRGALYRGRRLEAAEETFSRSAHRSSLTVVEAAFLDAGVAARDDERRAAVRTRRRVRTLLVSLSVLLVLVLAASAVGWQQMRAGDRQEIGAGSRRAATTADGLRASNPRMAMRLSVAAWELSRTPASQAALLSALHQPEQGAFSVPVQSDEAQRALTSDGRTLISVAGGQAHAWDLRNHRLSGRHRVPDVEDEAGAPSELSESGRVLVVPSGRGEQVRLWDMRTRRYRGPAFGPARTSESSSALALGTDDRTVVFAVDGTAEVWDARERRRLHFMPTGSGDDPVTDVSPDGRFLAMCGGARVLKVLDLRRAGRQLALHAGKVLCAQGVRFSPDGRTLIVPDPHGLRRWHLPSGREAPRLDQMAPRSLAVSDDGKFLAAAGDGGIALWRLSRPQAPVFRHPLQHPVDALRIDPSTRTLHFLQTEAGGVQVVRTLGLGRALEPSWGGRTVHEALFSTDASTLALAEDGGRRFRLLRGPTGRTTAILPAPARTEGGPLMSLSADGRRFAYGSGPDDADHHGQVIVWDAERRRPLARVPHERSGPEVAGAVLSPDGRALITTGWDSLTHWDARSGEPSRTLSRSVGSLVVASDGGLGELRAISADGGLILTNDGSLLSPATGRTLPHQLGSCGDCVLAFDQDADRIALLASQRVSLWDAGLNRMLAVLPTTGFGPLEELTAVAFSPDGTTLAVAGSYGTVRLWDLPSREPLGTGPTTPGDRIHALAFGPGSDVLYAAGEKVPWQKYVIDTDQAVAEVCRRAGGPLTRADWQMYLPGVPYRRVC
ncbi:hypothetical protein [Streptomyces silvensis]|uniref:HTH cro/C1-type domain-containing protein n=1 Tax=Streptomyces silvensis TaxID=1765722 RepID=A0A0W7X994_9ACTN|nr:hypothetical protein [Streptomyces silvensis]KUF19338.1 hypothetical protein AT728_30470 [Streptomyces silvensis]